MKNNVTITLMSYCYLKCSKNVWLTKTFDTHARTHARANLCSPRFCFPTMFLRSDKSSEILEEAKLKSLSLDTAARLCAWLTAIVHAAIYPLPRSERAPPHIWNLRSSGFRSFSAVSRHVAANVFIFFYLK